MASLYGILHRPLSAVAAVAVAAVSSEIPDRLNPAAPALPSQSDSAAHRTAVPSGSSVAAPLLSVSRGPLSHMSDSVFASLSLPVASLSQSDSAAHRTAVPSGSSVAAPPLPVSRRPLSHMPDSVFASLSLPVASPAVLSAPYQYAKLANPPKDGEGLAPPVPSAQSDALYRWHLPEHKAAYAANDRCAKTKSRTVVVLLGWLGAKQKHLKKYADWYTSRGYHVVTFTFPMSDVMSYKVGGKAEKNVDLLAEHLADWVSEENEKNLVFHTFSNTGWLTYGALLEKFQKKDPSVLGRIKGCIVDSAPAAAPDPQVWASGFSAAFLQKRSVGTKGTLVPSSSGASIVVSSIEPKPAAMESALLAMLEKFFEVVLNVPAINRRLVDVLDLLTLEQPKCPQLYIYSSADRVIPASYVEAFIERQRRAGHEVRACDFLSSPHVDHFRSHPTLYSSQLSDFLDDCVLTCCKSS